MHFVHILRLRKKYFLKNFYGICTLNKLRNTTGPIFKKKIDIRLCSKKEDGVRRTLKRTKRIIKLRPPSTRLRHVRTWEIKSWQCPNGIVWLIHPINLFSWKERSWVTLVHCCCLSDIYYLVVHLRCPQPHFHLAPNPSHWGSLSHGVTSSDCT